MKKSLNNSIKWNSGPYFPFYYIFWTLCIPIILKHFAFRLCRKRWWLNLKRIEELVRKWIKSQWHLSKVCLTLLTSWACKNSTENHWEEVLPWDPLVLSASAWIRNTMRVSFFFSNISTFLVPFAEGEEEREKRNGRKTWTFLNLEVIAAFTWNFKPEHPWLRTVASALETSQAWESPPPRLWSKMDITHQLQDIWQWNSGSGLSTH